MVLFGDSAFSYYICVTKGGREDDTPDILKLFKNLNTYNYERDAENTGTAGGY